MNNNGWLCDQLCEKLVLTHQSAPPRTESCRFLILKQYTFVTPICTILPFWTGLCCKTGLYDTSPERSFLTNIFGGGPLTGPGSRVLTIGATELNRGLLETWNETVQPNVLVNALMASSAIPGAFEMVVRRFVTLVVLSVVNWLPIK